MLIVDYPQSLFFFIVFIDDGLILIQQSMDVYVCEYWNRLYINFIVKNKIWNCSFNHF